MSEVLRGVVQRREDHGAEVGRTELIHDVAGDLPRLLNSGRIHHVRLPEAAVVDQDDNETAATAVGVDGNIAWGCM